MTKSTITRERLLEIIVTGPEASGAEQNELARMALAAMDSEAKEPISFDEWSRKCALQITLCYPDFREKAQYIWDSARETQQPAPEYSEVLPCSVLLEPGLRFGKGIKTSAMLAALARRAVYESDMAALSPEERAEFQARIEDFKALIAQPAPVVPDDVLEALQKVARIRLDLNDFDGDRRGIADCLGDAEEALIEVVNRRAAMLQAGNSPALTVWYGDMPETNGKTNWTAILHRKGECLSTGITIDRSEYPDRVRYEADRMRYLIGDLEYEPDILEYDSDAHSGYVPPTAAPGNSPVIPDGYVMVPKEPTKEMIDAGWLHYMGTKNPSSKGTYKAMLAAAPQEVPDEK
ncbi:TPA: hypothetical protein ACN3MW_001746 [Klebsiella pneumoniae]|nr:hypothetical protein [Klebsiella pneumoniae]HDS6671000.1 hypothetical protein [Klebsiella pneumoniae subsp. pneumoniae]HDS6707694.1 hypothetical protein [Klebsiella pneumoniae subsp. pneumoniae]HDS6944965.1 hypothetical protein [Klebsiella pneumoniae]HDT3116979.1 hypothetical protein [Klebsiella pneumoniae]